TALVRALHREVTGRGRVARLVDLGAIDPTAPGLMTAIAANGDGDPTAVVDRTGPVLVLDHFEVAGALGRYVRDQLLPGLDAGVKVVIASRRPLAPAWARHGAWHGLVHPLPLAGFSREESRAFLEARGLSGSPVAGQVLKATAGHPLAMVLACDMATQLGVADLGAMAEWRLVVRSLVGQLLQEVDDRDLRQLIEAGSIVRQFDESVLGAVSGAEEVSDAFAQLCHLSVIRPSGHGLALHDEVRHIVASDLRWRNPDRYRELRRRALAHYRDRMEVTTWAEERGWVVSDCFYLLENDFLQQWAFSRQETAGAWVDEATPEDRQDAFELFTTHRAELRCSSEELAPATLQELLGHEDTDVRILRGQRGRTVAFSLVVPLFQDSLRLLPTATAGLVSAYWDDQELAAVPVSATDATAYAVSRIVAPPTEGGPEVAALARNLLGLYARCGTYFLATSSPIDQAVAEILGYQRVAEAQVRPSAGGPPVEGFVLDLARIGRRRWLEAVMQGKPAPRPFRATEVREELRAVLLGWRDDDLLERSHLVELVSSGPDAGETHAPAVLRDAVLAALAAARAEAGPADELAYRAVELAYLGRPVSNERAAERLAVSRSSFYRALRRGVSGIADALLRLQQG
ncbi:MAG TPA: hypothetical protein VKI64_06490, partial [Acidimicrobiales bacterium]|nr:hypothetical protein [Acidimicrobiales bacterium]